MNVPGMPNIIPGYPKYSRLSENDITRMPNLNLTRADYYQGQKTNKPTRKNSYLKNIFTTATFALTGLYIAHRNNLFNPIKRETLKIIRDKKLQNKVKEFVSDKINDDSYKIATEKFLEKIVNNKKNAGDITVQANKILQDKELFETLLGKLKTKLNDDPTPDGLVNGYAVDILDRLKIKIEKMLLQNKNNAMPYKNQGGKIIQELFENSQTKSSIIDNTLYEAIINRGENNINNFIKDLIVAEKFGSL